MTVEESHFQVAKMPKSARHEARYPGVEDFRKGISTNNYGGTMPKNILHFSKF
jgi:hypothetical protein